MPRRAWKSVKLAVGQILNQAFPAPSISIYLFTLSFLLALTSTGFTNAWKTHCLPLLLGNAIPSLK
jgi:hypothetical protein